MGQPTKRELQEENESLREALERAASTIDEALGYDDSQGDGEDEEEEE